MRARRGRRACAAALVAALGLAAGASGCSADGASPLGSPPSLLADVDGEAGERDAPPSSTASPTTSSSASVPEQRAAAPAPAEPGGPGVSGMPAAPAAPAPAAAPAGSTGSTGEPGQPAQTAPPAPPAPVDPAVLADLAAGVLEPVVPQSGAGTTTVVPGGAPATTPGEPWRVRVEVEDGLPVDGAAFASFVITALQDPRGWGQDGISFSRTDGEADVVVTLASPDTSARMCAPLDTRGTLSCRNGDDVVLTHHRWVHGADAYGADRTSYRQYLVNHEVGHALGHGHVDCPGPGRLAPTMMQQTKGVGQCVAQPWPHP